MKKQAIKKPKAASAKKMGTVKTVTEKLTKKDPDYYKKIGAISAAKRKLNRQFFSEMAKKSHAPGSRPEGYKGGRKPKTDETTSL